MENILSRTRYRMPPIVPFATPAAAGWRGLL
jgi:hypothetical protein